MSTADSGLGKPNKKARRRACGLIDNWPSWSHLDTAWFRRKRLIYLTLGSFGDI